MRQTSGRLRSARTFSLALALAAASLQAPAGAAPAAHGYKTPTEPAKIAVVRSSDPDCVGICSDWISIEGAIGPGTANRFAATLKRLGHRQLPILINSPGGLITEAVEIGHLIRSKGLDVGVGRTALTDCASDPAQCANVPSGTLVGSPASSVAFCASACSFVLAAGVRRFVPLRSVVGVHQFRTYQMMLKTMRTFRIVTRKVDGKTVEVSRSLIAERPVSRKRIEVATPESRYDDAQRYFASMGITSKLMDLAEATAPNAIHWLSLAELVSTKMDTEGKDGAYMIAHSGDAVQSAVARVTSAPVRQSQAVQAPAPPSPTPAQAGPEAIPPIRVENATLTADGSQDREALHLDGWVTWSIDDKQASPALLGIADLSDGAGQVEVRIEDLGSRPGRPDYRISVLLRPGRDSPFRHPLAAMLPAVKVTPSQPAVELKGTADTVSPGLYRFDLATADPEAATDRQLMKGGVGLEFGFIVDPVRTLRLSLTRGRSGGEAFRRWRELVDARLLAG